MVAVGVRWDGVREVLGYAVARVENEAFWQDFLQDLKMRGLTGVKLIVSDAHEGLKKSIARVFPGALWQRSQRISQDTGTTACVWATFSSNGRLEPSYITSVKPAAIACITFSKLEPWSSISEIGTEASSARVLM